MGSHPGGWDPSYVNSDPDAPLHSPTADPLLESTTFFGLVGGGVIGGLVGKLIQDGYILLCWQDPKAHGEVAGGVLMGMIWGPLLSHGGVMAYQSIRDWYRERKTKS